MTRKTTRGGRGDAGFSLVEVMVAIVIFTVGVLALASSTSAVGALLRLADARTERQAAFEEGIETLRSVPYDSVVTRGYASAKQYGSYQVWWDVTDVSWRLRTVTLYARGPSYFGARRVTNVVDTLQTQIARPYP